MSIMTLPNAKLKLKVPIEYLKRVLIAPFLTQKPKFQQSGLWSFLKSLEFYSFFKDDSSGKESIKVLWVPSFFEHHLPEVIAQADRLHDAKEYIDEYELLNRVRLAKDPNILWRIARVLYSLSYHESASTKIKNAMITEAQVVLHMAFSNGTVENSNIHKWMAIILDAHSGLLNLENRVKCSTLVKYHLERACELNPSDFTVNYMLGKWCYQICQLSWIHRMIAKYFIATEPPTSDYLQAYKYLSRAEELQPKSLSNLFLLGSTCLQIGQYFKAKYYLNLALSLKAQNESEERYTTKAKRLIRKLDRYDLAKNVLFYDHDPFQFMKDY